MCHIEIFMCHIERFMGSIERFMGSIDIFMCCKERFMGSVERYMGSIERFTCSIVVYLTLLIICFFMFIFKTLKHCRFNDYREAEVNQELIPKQTHC